jgi:hypothetical protein
MDFTEDDIREWKREGWKFRVKTVKGNLYVTRRKGKEEKGLGRHSDVKWKLIENTSIGPTRSELRREGEELVEGLMKQLRVSHVSFNCMHIVDVIESGKASTSMWKSERSLPSGCSRQ